MIFLHKYIEQFQQEGGEKAGLAAELRQTKSKYDIFQNGDPVASFEEFVNRYNWLGSAESKQKYDIKQNLARNLPGALMQDYLLHLAIKLIEPYPRLETFTEVKVPFGRYPLWTHGEVAIETPSERSDIAIGYLAIDGVVVIKESWPKEPYYKLDKNELICPLITINSKIRVSQSEFFDWQGREQLMTKGNPHCLSVQVALRKEMDMSIVEASQAGHKFFLIGDGNERNVFPDRNALDELIEVVTEHLETRMG